MAIMADYIVVKDTSFELGENGELTFEFTLPSDFHSASNAFLAYLLYPDSSGGQKYEIDINDQVIRSNTVSTGLTHGLWEVFPGTMLKIGLNTVQFRVESTSGSLNFSDVILWHQRALPV
jgi:hypothetical protein